jgi:predicted N-acetyltransferase YhbS
MKLVPATGPLLEEILDESYDIWGEGLTRQAYGRYNAAQLRTEWGRAHLDRVALVDAGAGRRVLATAKRYDLTARLDAARCRVLGIGAVFTPPAARRQGHARRLVEMLMAQAARDGVALALLFSEIDPDYYARLGFAPIQTPALELAIAPGRRGVPALPMVPMRSGDDRDLPKIAEIAARVVEGYRFGLERPAAFVQYGLTKKRLLAGLMPRGARAVEFYVVEEGGQPAAYVILTSRREGWTLEECGDRDPTGARVGAMLQVLRARAPDRAQPRLRAWLPPRFLPPQITVVDHAPPIAANEPIMMIRGLGAKPAAIEPSLGAGDVVYWHGDIF